MQEKKNDISNTLFSAGGLLIVLLIIILVNVLFSGINLRFDITEEKLYSLSDATKTIISEIKHPVTIKAFYSKSIENMPVPIKAFAPRAMDILKEYKAYGAGKIGLEIYNPKPDSPEEEWAKTYGIKGIDLPTGDTLYFGMVILSSDREETLSFLDPSKEKHLEYDITHAITKVQSETRPKVGILSFIDIYGNPPSPALLTDAEPERPSWYFIKALNKTYDVSEVRMTAKTIDPDLDLLFMLFPKGMSRPMAYAVDQFLLRGGRLIVMADPFTMVQGDAPDYAKWYAPDDLFSAWGIEMDSHKALVDFGFATRYVDRNNQVVENPLWLSLGEEAFNPKNVISANLDSMLFSISGAIFKIKDLGLTYEPLIQSSAQSQLFNRNKIRNLPEIRKEFTPSEKRMDMAVLLGGNFKTAFPEGLPADDSIEKHWTKPHVNQSVVPSSVLVVADVDMISDGNYVEHKTYLGQSVSEPFNDNLNFILNACEVLTGNEELVNIRSRGKFERPFHKVMALEKAAKKKWLSQEQALVKKIEETSGKLKKLEQQKDASQQFVISSAQEAEIEKFKSEKAAINKKLKKVRRNLSAEIDRLGLKVKFINIFLMPILVSIIGIAYAAYKRNKAVSHKNQQPV